MLLRRYIILDVLTIIMNVYIKLLIFNVYDIFLLDKKLIDVTITTGYTGQEEK